MTAANEASEVTVHEVDGMQKVAMHLLGKAVVLWQNSLTYIISEKDRNLAREARSGGLLLMWHNRLFPAFGCLRHLEFEKHQIHGLVSASRDGARLASFMRAIHVVPLRGSSSRRAATATREMVRVLGNGGVVSITIDGPRGPCYHAQAGAAMLALRLQCPIYLVNVEPASCWRLNSWDRFMIPRPFTKVEINVQRLSWRPATTDKEGREALRQRIESGLMALTRTL